MTCIACMISTSAAGDDVPEPRSGSVGPGDDQLPFVNDPVLRGAEAVAGRGGGDVARLANRPSRFERGAECSVGRHSALRDLGGGKGAVPKAVSEGGEQSPQYLEVLIEFSADAAAAY